MSFVYLASPYTHRDPAVREERFRAVCAVAARLMMHGHVVFSPIAHSHSVETLGLTTVQTGEFWKKQDVPILRHAERLIILMLPGWEDSKGIKWEIETAKNLLIPVEYLEAT